jgi:hypothetical protein
LQEKSQNRKIEDQKSKIENRKIEKIENQKSENRKIGKSENRKIEENEQRSKQRGVKCRQYRVAQSKVSPIKQ